MPELPAVATGAVRAPGEAIGTFAVECAMDELAEELGLEPYGWATLVSPRAAIEARVLVTERLRPLRIGEQTIHQIGLPFHYGESDTTEVTGDGANDLLGLTLEPNVLIQNSKIGACDIQPGRRPRGEGRLKLLKQYQERAQLSVDSGNDLLSVPDSFTYNPEPEKHGQSGADSSDDETASEGEKGK